MLVCRVSISGLLPFLAARQNVQILREGASGFDFAASLLTLTSLKLELARSVFEFSYVVGDAPQMLAEAASLAAGPGCRHSCHAISQRFIMHVRMYVRVFVVGI